MVNPIAIVLLAFAAGRYCQGAGSPDGDSYIYDGTPAKPGSLPYVVAILTRLLDEKEAMVCCSGALISPNKILVAGHCFDYFSEKRLFYAGLGYADLETGDKRPGAKLVRIISFERPKEYKAGVPGRDIRGDVAVGTLETEVTLSDTIKLAPLGGKTKAELIGKTGFVAGWGNHSGGILMIANGQTVAPDDTERCKQLVKNQPIPPSVMCVTNNGEESCKGDSGAAFVIDGKVEGMVSWGPRCGHGDPGFYTNLGFYLSWVKARL